MFVFRHSLGMKKWICVMGKIIILLFVILSASSGCTVLNTYRFRVEDATDGHPIAGVQAEGNNDRYEPHDFGWPVLRPSTHHYTISNPEGLVRFDGGGQNEVTFAKEGYEPCTVVASSPGYKQNNKLFGRRTFAWEDERTPIILLQPLNSKPEEQSTRNDAPASGSQAD